MDIQVALPTWPFRPRGFGRSVEPDRSFEEMTT